LWFLRQPAFSLGGLTVSLGAVSLAVILYRAALCVSAVLILVAVTPFSQLTGQLRRLHVPQLFLLLFEMTYRYIGTLLDQAYSMYTAYILRAPGGKGRAMKCRGYALRDDWAQPRPLLVGDWLFLLFGGGLPLMFRLADLPALVGGWMGGLL
jgi:cobalt/nickel transport system permease protein